MYDYNWLNLHSSNGFNMNFSYQPTLRFPLLRNPVSRYLWIIVTLITLVFAVENAEATPERVLKVSAVPVTVIDVTTGDIKSVTTVQGIIESKNTPHVSSMVAAEVVQVDVNEGDTVVVGQVLALMDGTRFRLEKTAAEANVERLQALLENQKLFLKRDQSLFKQKTIPVSKLDTSMSAVRQTHAQIRLAQARLKIANYALSHTRIVAPISGIIQTRSVSKGDYINPMSPSGKPLFQIVDTRHLRARLYFPETLAEVIKLGMSVTLNKGTDRLRAKITRIRPMLERQSLSLDALAEFDNSQHWKPGESITANVVLAQHNNVVIIPVAALVQRPAGNVVYQLKNGKAKEKPVVTGIRQGDKVEIISGLNAGARIALDGAAYLSNGVRVQIKSQQ